MTISTFKMMQGGNILVNTGASTLDLVTASLPQGFYTTFSTLAHGTRVLDLQSHLERLYAPAKKLRLHPIVDKKTLRQRIAGIAKLNSPNESRLRLILTEDSADIFVCAQIFIPLDGSVYANGAHVITAEITRHDPKIKDTGFISESATQRNLLSKDVFEVLLTHNGKILEGMTSNFYAILYHRHNNVRLITAKHGILAGVTRKAVLNIAKRQGMPIEYRSPQFNEKFDEAFLTSSSRGVVPIVSIDDKSVGQGRVGRFTRQLSRAYENYVSAKAESIS